MVSAFRDMDDDSRRLRKYNSLSQITKKVSLIPLSVANKVSAHIDETPVWQNPVEYVILWVQVNFACRLLGYGWVRVGDNLCLLCDTLCLLYP